MYSGRLKIMAEDSKIFTKKSYFNEFWVLS